MESSFFSPLSSLSLSLSLLKEKNEPHRAAARTAGRPPPGSAPRTPRPPRRASRSGGLRRTARETGAGALEGGQERSRSGKPRRGEGPAREGCGGAWRTRTLARSRRVRSCFDGEWAREGKGGQSKKKRPGREGGSVEEEEVGVEKREKKRSAAIDRELPPRTNVLGGNSPSPPSSFSPSLLSLSLFRVLLFFSRFQTH